MKKKISLIVLLFICFVILKPAVSQEYPGRAQYPKAPFISTEDLRKDYEAGNVIIIDVRSKIEFDVIHVDTALHVPISNKLFANDVKAIADKNPGKKIAFYCNGITCHKSYVAAEKSIEAGISNCFAYDDGIPKWAKVYPANTILLGKVITDPEKQLISKDDFKAKCIDFETFSKQALSNPDNLVIDVRDHIQSTGALPGLENARKVPLDTFIPNFVEKKLNQDKTLFIFDQVGKQVDWLQYYLIQNGYTNYFFLDGGATKVLEGQQTYK